MQPNVLIAAIFCCLLAVVVEAATVIPSGRSNKLVVGNLIKNPDPDATLNGFGGLLAELVALGVGAHVGANHLYPRVHRHLTGKPLRRLGRRHPNGAYALDQAVEGVSVASSALAADAALQKAAQLWDRRRQRKRQRIIAA